ncbi:uncharacterized protein LOC109856545 [Pseudomyrmex gracilis]|uniref:uncharacterized protein LOC109856545 n=1 Tax=Pseudomyrmex gracilis TaxID=219809 RepID=UPI000994F399|nr:uncharacterized protein LOC109856545 [Pseudomyrmex gracilis]
MMHDSSISSSEDEGYDDIREQDSAAGSDVLEKSREPSTALTDSSDFAPLPGEEDKYILTKKIVEKVREVPVLHMICGHIDGSRIDLPDTTFFYFMRTSDEGVPSFDTYEECLDEMPSYIVVGSLGRKFLASFNSMLVEVFRPLVENQFRGPDFAERWKIEKTMDEPSSVARLASAALTEGEESVTRKPSGFRRKASESRMISATLAQDEADELEEKMSIEDDRKSRTSKSKSVSTISLKEMKKPMTEQCKKDILYHLDNLIKSVEWTLEHIESDILLTMPKIPELSDPAMTDEMLLKNKDIVEQMEQEVMLWEKHIQKAK